MAPPHASKNKKRLDVLQNQIHPSEMKTESTKYFGLVNQENILTKRNETVKIRQVFSNISNLFQDIYLLLEKEDEIVEKSDWWDQMKKVKIKKKINFSKMVSHPQNSSTEKEKKVLIQEIEEFPVIPSFTVFFFKSVDLFLNSIKAINLICLVTVMKTHLLFKRLKPRIIKVSMKLQSKMEDVNLNVKASIETRTTKMLMNLRKKRPAQYYQM
jgi:hypothetical protein